MNTKVKNKILLILSFVFLGIFLIPNIMILIKNNKIEKERDRIKEYSIKIKEYEHKIDSINVLYKEQEIKIDSINKVNKLLDYQITELEKIKIIKKDGTIIKIQTIDNFNTTQLDSFFSNRFFKISKDSTNR